MSERHALLRGLCIRYIEEARLETASNFMGYAEHAEHHKRMRQNVEFIIFSHNGFTEDEFYAMIKEIQEEEGA